MKNEQAIEQLNLMKMKNEQAIEQLNLMIQQHICYEEVVLEDDNEDAQEELHETEVELEALRMAVQALEEKPRWIPCAERLPSDENKVLCCTQTKAGAKNIVLGYYAGGKWRCGMNSNVVVWKPLPEVYKED